MIPTQSSVLILRRVSSAAATFLPFGTPMDSIAYSAIV